MNVDGQMVGAMSFAFIDVSIKSVNPSYRDLLVGIREELEQRGKRQRPQLSCCHPLGESERVWAWKSVLMIDVDTNLLFNL